MSETLRYRLKTVQVTSTVGQARMLAEALTAAVRLRATEECADHDDQHVRVGR